MTDKVEETGQQRYQRLNKEAKEMGIDTNGMNTAQLVKAIEVKNGDSKTPSEKDDVKGPTGISTKEAKDIEARLRFEDETREKIRRERQLAADRAEIIAESESLGIPIDLSGSPTELDLARARQTLGIKKREVKPSPETLGIEAGKRGYYIFNNLEQEDANHTVNPGGKYVIHLIAGQVHVLSDYHIKFFANKAVRPVYERVQTGVNPSANTEGQVVEKCVMTGKKRRFSFEYLGEAPVDAEFGLVTDAKILEELTVTS